MSANLEISAVATGLETSVLIPIPKKVRRDKKAFLSEQCKEIEENNRMGKTRDKN